MKAQPAGSGCPGIMLKMQSLYYAAYEIHWAFASWQRSSGLHRRAERACVRAQHLVSAALGKAEELSWCIG